MGVFHRLASLHLPHALERRARDTTSSRQGVVLMYHEVLPDEIDLPVWTVVARSNFQRQMRYLRRHYDVISMSEAIERVYSNTYAPASNRPFAVVTFDDGYLGNLSCAMPILQLLELPFTVFVATGKVAAGGLHWYDKVILHLLSQRHCVAVFETSLGQIVYQPVRLGAARRWQRINAVLDQLKSLPESEREELVDHLPARRERSPLRMLSPAELGRLAKSPYSDIGCHTHGHELLDQIPRDTARESIISSRHFISDCIGRRPAHFSYPNGNFNPSVQALVQELGFASAVTTEDRHWTDADDRYAIPRIAVGRFDSMSLFRAKLAGVLPRPAS